jgi:hypothetical protein
MAETQLVATKIARGWEAIVEAPLDKLNLLDNRPKRAFVFAGSTAVLLNIFKPSSLFDKKGNPYPSRLWDKDGVYVDYLTLSAFVGFFSIIFI